MISKVKAADSILLYDQYLSAIINTQENYKEDKDKAEDILYELIDVTCFYESNNIKNNKFIPDNSSIEILNDQQKLQRFYNYLQVSKNELEELQELNVQHLIFAKNLIKFLKGTYCI